MSENTLKIKKGAAALPLEDIDRVLSAGDGDAALLYLYLVREEGNGRLAAERLGFSPARADRAEKILLQAGVLESEGIHAPEKGKTAPTVLRERRENSPELDALCRAYEQAAGRPLRRDELAALDDAHVRLQLPAPVLLTLIHSLSAGGRTISAFAFEKEACRWADRSIDTLEKAEAYLKEAEKQNEALCRSMRLMQLDGRPLSPTERRYLTGWLEMGFTPEALERAYDKTVVNTGGLKWRYMDKILQSWHQAGLHTAEEAAREGAPGKTGGDIQASSGRTSSGMVSADYARMVDEYLKREEENGNVS